MASWVLLPLLTCFFNTHSRNVPPTVSPHVFPQEEVPLAKRVPDIEYNSRTLPKQLVVPTLPGLVTGAGAGLEFSPRPNSPIGVVRIQSPVYKESPRLLLKHPSHPQLHMSPNSGGPQGHGHTLNASSNSAHAPPGHSRFGVGSTSLAPGKNYFTTTTSSGEPATSESFDSKRLSHGKHGSSSNCSNFRESGYGKFCLRSNPTCHEVNDTRSTLVHKWSNYQHHRCSFNNFICNNHFNINWFIWCLHKRTDDNVIRKPSSDITQVPSRRVWELRSQKDLGRWWFV